MEFSELCTPGRDACGRDDSLYGGEDRAHTLQCFCFLSPALTKPVHKCKVDKSPYMLTCITATLPGMYTNEAMRWDSAYSRACSYLRIGHAAIGKY